MRDNRSVIADGQPSRAGVHLAVRPSGRGLLLIRNIMDEVAYSSRGNVVTMVKRSPSAANRIDPNAGRQSGPGDSQQAS